MINTDIWNNVVNNTYVMISNSPLLIGCLIFIAIYILHDISEKIKYSSLPLNHGNPSTYPKASKDKYMKKNQKEEKQKLVLNNQEKNEQHNQLHKKKCK